MIYLTIMLVIFLFVQHSTRQKMKEYKKHKKACKKRGIKMDESMWVPR